MRVLSPVLAKTTVFHKEQMLKEKKMFSLHLSSPPASLTMLELSRESVFPNKRLVIWVVIPDAVGIAPATVDQPVRSASWWLRASDLVWHWEQNASFLRFPYVCPDPVLVK